MSNGNQVTLTCTLPSCTSPSCPTCNCEGCCDGCNCDCCDCSKCCNCDCNCNCADACTKCTDKCTNIGSCEDCIGLLFLPCLCVAEILQSGCSCKDRDRERLPLWAALATCQCLCGSQRCCDPQDMPGSGLSLKEILQRKKNQQEQQQQQQQKESSDKDGAANTKATDLNETHPPDAHHLQAMSKVPTSQAMENGRPGPRILSSSQKNSSAADFDCSFCTPTALRIAIEHGDISVPVMIFFIGLGALAVCCFLIHDAWDIGCDSENKIMRWFLAANVFLNIVFLSYIGWVMMIPGVRFCYCFDPCW
eukprot:TRINITY_DN5846_c0_g1_i4.p1 TRINITY_DN5846_c0_g1~~TRINITY_DN5846_c0_g1_i4.p1  ORF type:complete len:306 (+),score=51.37 TRINITY_DN5846_c0_g1_i4:50-967(+)